jgi:hypothetical protein
MHPSSLTELPASTAAGLEAFRAELADLAFHLDRQGRLDAADAVMMIRARLQEIAGDDIESTADKPDNPFTSIP